MDAQIIEAQRLISLKQADQALAILTQQPQVAVLSQQELALASKLTGLAHEQLVRFTEALEAFSRARDLYLEIDDERAASECSSRCAINLIRIKQLRDGLHLCNAELCKARDNGWKDIEAIALRAQSLAEYYQGDREAAVSGMLSLYELYKELGATDEMHELSGNIAMIYLELGEDKLAKPFLESRDSGHPGQADIRQLAKGYLNAAVAAWYQDELETAKEQLTKAIQIGLEQQNHRILANAQTNLGLVYLDGHEYRVAHKMLILGWQNAVKCSDSQVVSAALTALAITMVFLNDPAQGLDYLTLSSENATLIEEDESVLLEYYRAIINLANDNLQPAKQYWEGKSRLPQAAQLDSDLEWMSRLFEHIGTAEFRVDNDLSDEALDLAAQWCSELGELELGKE